MQRFALVITLLLVLAPMSGRAQPPEAVAVIERFNGALLESMRRADALGLSGRFKYLKPVIEKSFAIPLITKISVGKYWRKLNAQQQRELIHDYLEWSTANYARQFDSFSGERFQFISASNSDQQTVAVISQLIKPDAEKIDFHYILRLLEGQWQIIDIQISGVSQLALTRSQFVSVIESDGFEALINLLQGKVKDISSGTDP
ncbi:MAG: ABC transporter substrate-binding protein [Desulfobacterales bacterium]